MHERSQRLSLRTKLAFGVGDFGHALAISSAGFFKTFSGVVLLLSAQVLAFSGYAPNQPLTTTGALAIRGLLLVGPMLCLGGALAALRRYERAQ